MSGPQLTTLAAIVVALVALVGVAALVLQVRRLRAEMSAVRAGSHVVAAGGSGLSPVTGTGTGTATGPVTVTDGRSDAGGVVLAEETPPQPGEPSLASRSSGPAQPSATVVELVPAPSDPTWSLPADPDRFPQLVAARPAQPLVRVSAVAYGVRHALRAENRDRVVALVRRDLRRRHKLRRLAGRRAFRVVQPSPDDRTAPGAERQESAS